MTKIKNQKTKILIFTNKLLASHKTKHSHNFETQYFFLEILANSTNIRVQKTRSTSRNQR